MHKLAKIGMVIWTILCAVWFLQAIIAAQSTPAAQRDVAVGFAGIICGSVWAVVTSALGVIMLATKPKETTVSIKDSSMVLCADCGKYYTGTPTFCPNCGVKLGIHPPTSS